MSQAGNAVVMNDSARDGGSPRGGAGGSGSPTGGFFQYYKREQGKWTRMGTFAGLMALTAWGAKFLYDRLQVFEGDEVWQLLVTRGIPLLFLAVVGAVSWWVSYSNRKTSDFMIATEGEMKKVSWSTRSEVIGSTKVVILFTVLLAALLFGVDLIFQTFFSWIGVLKVGG